MLDAYIGIRWETLILRQPSRRGVFQKHTYATERAHEALLIGRRLQRRRARCGVGLSSHVIRPRIGSRDVVKRLFSTCVMTCVNSLSNGSRSTTARTPFVNRMPRRSLAQSPQRPLRGAVSGCTIVASAARGRDCTPALPRLRKSLLASALRGCRELSIRSLTGIVVRANRVSQLTSHTRL
jgi:hypothetical protein